MSGEHDVTPVSLTPPNDQNDPTKPVTDDQRRWAQEALDARHKSLASVQTTADSWGKSITAILGAFALVAFLKGPEAINDVPTGSGAAFEVGFGVGTVDPARTVVLLIFISAAVVILAVVAAAFAAQGTPGWTKVLDGPTFKTKSENATKNAIHLLWASRILTLIGAMLVFGALALAWMASIDKLSKTPDASQAAIVSTAGSVVCGELRSRADGSIEVVPKGGQASVIAPATTVTLVDSCPAQP
jgi:hypothetical protein